MCIPHSKPFELLKKVPLCTTLVTNQYKLLFQVQSILQMVFIAKIQKWNYNLISKL